DGSIPPAIGAIVMAPAAPIMVRVMPALPPIAVPEAPRFGRLPRRDAHQQGSGGQRAKNESHDVPPEHRFARKTLRRRRAFPINRRIRSPQPKGSAGPPVL